MRRLIAYTHGRDDPAGRFRIAQYAGVLRDAGWELSLRPRSPERPWDAATGLQRRCGAWLRRRRRLRDIDASADYDAAFVSRDLLEGRRIYEQRLLEHNSRVVFDFDDAIYLDADGGLGEKAEHVAWMCERAAWVTTGAAVLAEFARQYTDRVTVLPTVVDVDSYAPADGLADERGDGPVRVGWLGSDRSIHQTLYPAAEMLRRVQRELGFELVVVSKPRPDLPSSLRWSYQEWTPAVETRIAERFDVGIMPLDDTPFQRGKCGCKLIQYMAAGLPWVASPVGMNRSLAGAGERGLLASTESEWREALGSLVRDAALRRRLGAAGRIFVRQNYSLGRWFPTLLDTLVKVSAARR